jgi:hypothetical protein
MLRKQLGRAWRCPQSSRDALRSSKVLIGARDSLRRQIKNSGRSPRVQVRIPRPAGEAWRPIWMTSLKGFLPWACGPALPGAVGLAERNAAVTLEHHYATQTPCCERSCRCSWLGHRSIVRS